MMQVERGIRCANHCVRTYHPTVREVALCHAAPSPEPENTDNR